MWRSVALPLRCAKGVLYPVCDRCSALWRYFVDTEISNESCSIPRGTLCGGTFIFPGVHSKVRKKKRQSGYLNVNCVCRKTQNAQWKTSVPK
ncbi:uncharacterized protein LOC116435244 isoform X2 [Nomia melanderi]|uniref:uncharacterized protein LOC116435244 isoform X2 n=1 Tax=Nomia melanderi TaxID=2448451 RepID=UPI003FCE2557